jgi:hypothetical protein
MIEGAPMANNEALLEIDRRMAVVQDNLRELIEQAAAFSGAANEARNADRIATKRRNWPLCGRNGRLWSDEFRARRHRPLGQADRRRLCRMLGGWRLVAASSPLRPVRPHRLLRHVAKPARVEP